MGSTIRVAVATWCRDTRIRLDISQAELAAAVGIARSHLAAIEAGTANPTLDVIDRLGTALDTTFELRGRVPVLLERAVERDAVHAWCMSYLQRRLRGLGLDVAREVPVIDGRARGWIDLLAFDRRTGTLFVVEVKTGIDDVGAIERQVGWYERMAPSTEPARRWTPARSAAVLLLLATAAVEESLVRHRDAFDGIFPVRARELQAAWTDAAPIQGRAAALIDPRRRRHDWLLPSKLDGRRSPAPYPDVAAARRSLRG